MAVIFFDTDCELWYEQIKDFDIKLIKMPYTVDDKEYYYDLGENTDFKWFYDTIRKGSMPSTSALNEYEYIEYFEPYFKAGEDIVYISFGTNFSGTFNQMQKAVDKLSAQYPDAKFRRFDTNSISFGAGLQVYYALKFYYEGNHTTDELMEYLEANINSYKVCFMVDDLMHLKRGGRLSGMSAAVGTILGVKPILKVTDEGKLSVYNKERGTKKAIAFIANEVKNHGAELDKYNVIVLDADNKELADALEAEIHSVCEATVERYPVGPVIGAHCGPGTVAAIFRSKDGR